MVSDEMVEKATLAYFDAMFGSLDRGINTRGLKAALEAVAPMIRAAALEEAVGAVRASIRYAGEHPSWCQTYGETLGWDDAEIARIGPFMRAYVALVRRSTEAAIRAMIGKEPT